MSAVAEDTFAVLRLEEWMIRDAMDLMREIHGTVAFSDYDYDEKRVETALGAAIHNEHVFAVANVDMESHELNGILIAHLETNIWSPQLTARAGLCYAKSETALAEMLARLLDWAKRAQIHRVVVDCIKAGEAPEGWTMIGQQIAKVVK